MKQYFFCYDPKLSKRLASRGFTFITNAIHKETSKEFWLYAITEELDKEIKDWLQK